MHHCSANGLVLAGEPARSPELARSIFPKLRVLGTSVNSVRLGIGRRVKRITTIENVSQKFF